MAILEALDTDDWEEAFKYASNPTFSCGHDHGMPAPAHPFDHSVAVTPFTRGDVAEIVAIVEGERDEENWVGVFHLTDGRYAVLRAWCDFTGWG